VLTNRVKPFSVRSIKNEKSVSKIDLLKYIYNTELINNNQLEYLKSMSKTKALNRYQQQNVIALKKISTLSLKVIAMIEEDAKCYDILQQLQSLMGLIKKSQNRAMQCSIEQALDTDNRINKQTLDEIEESLNLFNK
jgi:DNA-binding FrmR family transcriptional regulator